MDTTEKYILMCKEATEIQKFIPHKHPERSPRLKKGSLIAFFPEGWQPNGSDQPEIYTIEELGWFDLSNQWAVYVDTEAERKIDKEWCWIPRQSDLQLIYTEKKPNGNALEAFCRWYNSQNEICQLTPEKLWLMFVMENVYDIFYVYDISWYE